MFKIKIKRIGDDHVYTGKYFSYLEKFYKIVGVRDGEIRFTLPGTYSDNTLDNRKDEPYSIHRMELSRFERILASGEYMFRTEEAVPERLRSYKKK